MNNRTLRSGLSVLLVLCMLLTTPVSVLAAGQTTAEGIVAEAVDLCGDSQKIVDMIVDMVIDGEYASIFKGSNTSSAIKSIAISKIVEKLDANENLMKQIGFEPTDANKDLIANEIYSVACIYYDEMNRSGGTRDSANKLSVIDLIRFILKEAQGYTNNAAQETAECYHEVNRLYKTQGEAAALEYAESFLRGDNHTHSYTSVVTEPTCTEMGYTTYTCSCGDSYTGNETAATGHAWGNGVVTKEPTETTTGIRTYTCSSCGTTKTEEIPVVEPHTHKYTSKVTKPTCTEKGYTTYTCSCGDSYVSDETAAKGHTWNDGVVTKEPTETTTGIRTYTCTTCRTTRTEEIPTVDHTHKYTSKVTKPTCTEKGYTTYTCSCGDSYVSNETAAKGHTWNDGVVTKEPTETTTGIRTYTCTTCRTTRTEEIPVVEPHIHNYSSKTTQATCTEAGYITYTCSCGDTYTEVNQEARGHSAVTDKGHAATCTEDGLTDGSHCRRCSEVLTAQEVIPATGHTFKNGTCTACGAADPDAVPETPDAPAVPSIVSCYSKEQTSVKVTWTVVNDADGYELWRSTTPDKSNSWTRVKSIMDNKTDRYTNQGLEVGTTYYYKVRAFVLDANGERICSAFSAVDYMPAAVVFDAPYSNSTSRIRLLWNEVSGADGYQIWGQQADGSWKIVKTIGDKGNVLTESKGSTTAYSNTGLTAGSTYTYKMRAFTITEGGKKVFGAYSDAYSIAVKPEAPVVAATAPKAECAKITWEAVNGAAGYQIWMAESENGQYKIVKSVTDSSTSYTKYDLESGKTYYFKVRAYAEAQERKAFSAYSDIVAVTAK